MEAKALAEVYDIVNHFEPEMYNKIPKEVIQSIKDNKDNNCEVNIDYSKNINEQGILRETKAMLAIIYREYICSVFWGHLPKTDCKKNKGVIEI